jgi:hypothetical protein
MTNDLTITTDAIVNDGWGDAAAEAGERVIKGTLLKFGDWRWSRGKEAASVEDGTRLVAVGTGRAWVKWVSGKPVEYRMGQPGKPMPEREELGDLDKMAWELGPDGITPRDPWQNTRFVYLVDPQTAEAFTFSTQSVGGRSAVNDLGDQIQRMRIAHPGAVPVVELTAAPWATRYGQKSRPLFKVVGWRHGQSDAPVQLENKPAAKPRVAEAIDDEIPF